VEIPWNFDRSKPFYPLVMNYLVQLAGFKEIQAGAALNLVRNQLTGSQPLTSKPAVQGDPGGLASLLENIDKLRGPLSLRSDTQGFPIEVDIKDLAVEVFSRGPYLTEYLSTVSAWSLLIVAFELSKPWHDRGPLWQFLRHCRNAAAHGGEFTFRRGEPRYPAKWASIEITPSFHGSHLVATRGQPGLLWPGDAVRLLWDIEQAYPTMKA
jgi:hypothetical protein